jgi:hypothetical protein
MVVTSQFANQRRQENDSVEQQTTETSVAQAPETFSPAEYEDIKKLLAARKANNKHSDASYTKDELRTILAKDAMDESLLEEVIHDYRANNLSIEELRTVGVKRENKEKKSAKPLLLASIITLGGLSLPLFIGARIGYVNQTYYNPSKQPAAVVMYAKMIEANNGTIFPDHEGSQISATRINDYAQASGYKPAEIVSLMKTIAGTGKYAGSGLTGESLVTYTIDYLEFGKAHGIPLTTLENNVRQAYDEYKAFQAKDRTNVDAYPRLSNIMAKAKASLEKK